MRIPLDENEDLLDQLNSMIDPDYMENLPKLQNKQDLKQQTETFSYADKSYI